MLHICHFWSIRAITHLHRQRLIEELNLFTETNKPYKGTMMTCPHGDRRHEMAWNGMECGMQWNGMEWNGMLPWVS